MGKRKILILIDWYLPGFRAGGPIQSCANLIGHLKDEFDFSVATTDSDLGADQPYTGIQQDQWNLLPDGTRVYYFSKTKLGFNNLKQFLLREDFDTVYMNSLFSKYFTIYPLLILKRVKPGVKIIVAPRGMLGSGALNIKSLKKKFFIAFSKRIGLYRNVTWHASTETENREVKTVFGNNIKVETALNLPSVRKIERIKRIKESGKLNLVFFSRISVKKNLHRAIQFLQLIDKNLDVIFDIYGLKEDAAYWSMCEQEIDKLGLNVNACYKGVIENSMIPEVLKKYHFSILPSVHENYGHSIVESFAAGCPVIISNHTPWQNLESKKAGWDISLNNPKKFTEALSYATRMQQQEFDEWSGNVYEFAETIFNNKMTVEQNRQLFS